MKLRRATLVWPLAGVLVAGAAWLDRGSKEPSVRKLVSNAPGARRVFPELGDREARDATIEFQAPDAALVRLVPNPEGGHTVMAGEELLGPADAEAVEGIWSSLRLATTLRAAPAGLDVGAGRTGVVRLAFSDQTMTLELGARAPDGAGVYGVLSDAEGSPWVVEDELAWLVEQAPEAWLSGRLSALEPAQVQQVAWEGGPRLVRGEDGRFRTLGTQPALLSTEAVEGRLERLLAARVDPLVARADAEGQAWSPWLQVTTDTGETLAWQRGESCEGYPERMLVDRGPGRLGCVDAEFAATGTGVGEGLDALLESRLIPHGYGRVLTLQSSAGAQLRRRPGGWRLIDERGSVDVEDDEVFRFYDRLAGVDVEVLAGAEAFEPALSLEFEMDSGQVLRVGCAASGDRTVCRRDEGPVLAVVGAFDLGSMDVSRKSFAPRRLLDFDVDDVRALEIDDADGTRQSLHFDLGVWALDAPEHPDGTEAIDDIRLEGLLSALAHLRASAWVEPPGDPPARTIAIDLVPSSEGREHREVKLWSDCTVVVGEQKPAQLSTAACETIAGDVFFDDPLRFWLQSARSFTVEGDGERREYTRGDAGWTRDEGGALDASDLALLEQLENWRSEGIVKATSAPDEVQARITIRRDAGPDVRLELSEGHLRVAGARWVYRRAKGVKSD